jgi:hypothetical protein
MAIAAILYEHLQYAQQRSNRHRLIALVSHSSLSLSRSSSWFLSWSSSPFLLSHLLILLLRRIEDDFTRPSPASLPESPSIWKALPALHELKNTTIFSHMETRSRLKIAFTIMSRAAILNVWEKWLWQNRRGDGTVMLHIEFMQTTWIRKFVHLRPVLLSLRVQVTFHRTWDSATSAPFPARLLLLPCRSIHTSKKRRPRGFLAYRINVPDR